MILSPWAICHVNRARNGRHHWTLMSHHVLDDVRNEDHTRGHARSRCWVLFQLTLDPGKWSHRALFNVSGMIMVPPWSHDLGPTMPTVRVFLLIWCWCFGKSNLINIIRLIRKSLVRSNLSSSSLMARKLRWHRRTRKNTFGLSRNGDSRSEWRSRCQGSSAVLESFWK